MAHTIAHEINNPLEAITNLLYLLRGPLANSPDGSAYLLSAEKEVQRVSRIARQILSFHRESASPLAVDLVELLEDVLALNNREVVDKNLLIVKDWKGPVRINGFPAQLRQVFSNLIRNAIEASPRFRDNPDQSFKMQPLSRTAGTRGPSHHRRLWCRYPSRKPQEGFRRVFYHQGTEGIRDRALVKFDHNSGTWGTDSGQEQRAAGAFRHMYFGDTARRST